MAKAVAVCRCKYCGSEFEYITYKTSAKDARAFEEWASGHFDECPDCREKRIAEKREEMTRVAIEAAKSKAWPDLTGSEKQIAWASRIRETEIGDLMEKVEKYKEKYGDKYDYDLAVDAINSVLSHTQAGWWIDNRDDIISIAQKTASELEENPRKRDSLRTESHDPDEATIAKPENKVHNGIVDIRASEQVISASYPKDDTFRGIIKKLGYRWNRDESSWQLPINFVSGSPSERAAELGSNLLNAGFVIRIQDPDTLRKAIEGNYEPMCQRWISKNVKNGKFIISWARDDDFYDKAKRLPGAKYISPSIQVPAKEWESVLDFAYAYGFKLSPGAQKLVDELQKVTVVVRPASAKEAEYETHPLQDVLNSSRDIIEDLKDETDN